MNRKKMLFKLSAAIMCLALVLGICTSYQVRAEEAVYYASDQQGLMEKIKYAKDGDIILIAGTIEISELGSPDKQIVLSRATADSCIVTQQGVPATIQNVIFDGNNLNSNTPILTIQGGEFTVFNCTFENCGDPEFKGSSGSIGGAVRVKSGEGSFTGCSFQHNTAVVGGHIAVMGNATVSFYDCAMLDGRSGSGGAISINNGANCIIEGCTITENSSMDYGGGIANGGNIQVRRTKLFNNQTVNGGADIANKIGGAMLLEDSLEMLQGLFADEGIIVHGWVCDYDFEENIYIPDVEPTEENLLMLDFEYMQPEPGTDEPTESETPDEPTEPEQATTPEETETPDQPTQPESPDEPVEPTTPDESNPSDSEPEQKPDESEPPEQETPSDSAGDYSSTTTYSSSSTDNSNRSTNSSTTTDNSRRTNTSDSNNTSTVNNYYTQQPETQLPDNQPGVQTIVVPVESGGNGEPIEQTIRIESSPEGMLSGSAEGMTLNVNVNVGSEDTQQQPAAAVEKQSGVSWYQAAVLCLLSAILVCLIKKR